MNLTVLLDFLGHFLNQWKEWIAPGVILPLIAYLWKTRRNVKVKLKEDSVIEPSMFGNVVNASPTAGKSENVIAVEALYGGEQPVVLASAGLEVRAVRSLFKHPDVIQLKQGGISFPIELKPEHPCAVWISRADLFKHLGQKKINRDVSIRGFYRDTRDRTHRSKWIRISGFQTGSRVELSSRDESIRYLRIVDENVQKIEINLRRVAAEVSRVSDVNLEDIGMHAWIVQRVPEISEPVLCRIARFRLSDTTPSKRRYWRKDEGVVGWCWSKQAEFSIDLAESKYKNAAEAHWNELSKKDRLGMAFQDFVETTEPFRAVFASPIVSREDFIGCVSLNIDKEVTISFEHLWTEDMKRLLRRAATDIEQILH